MTADQLGFLSLQQVHFLALLFNVCISKITVSIGFYCNIFNSRVPTITPVISPSSDKQEKQSSNKEELTATWVDEPWHAEDDVVDVQQTKSSEE